MKKILSALTFSCVCLIGYAQSSSTMPKSMQGHKNSSVLATSKNSLSTGSTNGCPTKANAQSPANAAKPEFSIISIIPTLRLWLLPGNFPNPFSKDDD